MESKSKKQQKEQGKVFCDVCKKSIPQWLMPKHQYCQQHLKAKAARMFYQSKSKDNPYKKLKEDPELYGKSQATTFTTDYGQAMVNNQEATITKSKSKGIWALINDESTGNVYFKNRLSGKTQKNRPVGLLDEDFDEEVVQTIVVPQNSENIEEFEEIDEEEQARVGDWKEIEPSCWFGEEVNSEEERCEVLRYEIEAKKSRENRELTQREERLNTNEAVKLKIKHKSDDEILEKPVYKQQICTSLTFVKRTKKSKILI